MTAAFWMPATAGDGTGDVYPRDPTRQCLIDGEMLPGPVAVKGLVYKWQKQAKKPHGQNGERLTLSGRQVSEFKLELRMWRRPQWDAWSKLEAKLFPEDDKRLPTAHAFYHWQAQRVTKVTLVEAAPPEVDSKGLGVIVITAREYRPPSGKSAVTNPKIEVRRDQRARAAASANVPPAPQGRISKYRPVNQPLAPRDDDEASGP